MEEQAAAEEPRAIARFQYALKHLFLLTTLVAVWSALAPRTPAALASPLISLAGFSAFAWAVRSHRLICATLSIALAFVGPIVIMISAKAAAPELNASAYGCAMLGTLMVVALMTSMSSL